MQPAEIVINLVSAGTLAGFTTWSSTSRVMKMFRPCCDALRSSCAALRTLCFDVVTINGIFDALTVVASAADQITDLLVLYQFYVD